MSSGVNEATSYGVGAAAGLRALGTLRAGLLLLGPFNIALMGLSVVVLPETSRALARSVHALRRMVRGISSGLTALAFSWGVVVMLIPERLGRALLKTSWDPGRQLAIPVIAFAIAAGFAQGPTIGLRALAAAKESLRARVITAPVVIFGGLVGAITEGAAGAAWGLAIGNAARAAACFIFYKRAVIARERSLGAQVHELPADAVPHTHR
jgi:O-antigen/teichoic acid export membrane protein